MGGGCRLAVAAAAAVGETDGEDHGHPSPPPIPFPPPAVAGRDTERTNHEVSKYTAINNTHGVGSEITNDDERSLGLRTSSTSTASRRRRRVRGATTTVVFRVMQHTEAGDAHHRRW